MATKESLIAQGLWDMLEDRPIRTIRKPNYIDEIANHSFAIEQDLELLRSDANKLINAVDSLQKSLLDNRQEPRTR